jgi:type I restriction enzyme S subunit
MNTKQLRQKILDLAIRGKLVPQDPNDEPASVLLERIRAEKERLIKEKKIKADKKKSGAKSHYENFFEVPDSWTWVKLGEIGDWQSGSTPSRSNKDYFNGNILWLKTGDLKDNYIYEIPEKITEKALIETSLKVNPIGSVLIAMYGATIGKVGILTQPATTNQACCACSNFKGISNLYLFYLLIAYRDYFIQLGEGGAQPNISKIKITSTYIPLPPLAEQHRIVYEIERLFELVDTVEENKLSLEQFIAQTKSKVLDLAIRGKLVPQDSSDEPASVLLERIRNEQKFKKTTSDKFPYPFEVPSGWIWANGFTCFNPMENKKPVGDYFNYIDIEAIDNEKHVIKESRKLKVSEAPSRASRLINKGDTLFSMVRPYLENIAYVDRKHDKCIASTGFYVCKPNKLLYPRYLYFLMLSNYVINGLNSFMKGDNSPSINNTNITTFLYPIPPLSEQLRIVEKIEEIFKMLDKMQVNLQANT